MAEAPNDDIVMPDWLTSPKESGETEPAAAAEEEIPDWLADTPGEQIDMPDWLADDSAQPDDTPDWLSGDSEMATGLPGGETASGALGISPGWDTEDSDSLPDELPASSDDELPDWISSIPQADEFPESEAEISDLDTPEWLAEIPKAPDTGPLSLPAKPDSLPSIESDEGMPDWMAGLQEMAEETESAADLADQSEMPDWLAQISQTSDAGEDVPAPFVTEFAQTGDTSEPSDWLAELPMPAQEVTDLPPDDESTGQTDTWADAGKIAAAVGLGATAAAFDFQPDQPVPDDAEAPAGEEDIPDWLADLRVSTEAPESRVEEDDDAVPAWLLDTPNDQIATPDWLADASDSVAGLTPAAIDEESAVSDQTPDFLEDQEDLQTGEAEGDTPDWLIASTESTETLVTEIDTDNEPSDWLVDLPELADAPEPVIEDEILEEGDSDLFPADEAAAGPQPPSDVPDWLSDLPDVDGLPETIPEIEAAVDMPEWLSDLPVLDEKTGSEHDPETEDAPPDWLVDVSTEQVEMTGRQPDQPEIDDEAEDAVSPPVWLAADEKEGDFPVEEDNESLDAGTLAAAAAGTAVAGGMVRDVLEKDEPDSTLTGDEDLPLSFTEEEETQSELPDWLADLPGTDDTGEVAPDTSDWLIDLPSSTTEEAAVEEPTDQLDVNLQAAVDLEKTHTLPKSGAIAETDEVLPDWLSDLPPPPGETSDLVPEPDTEQDTPDWLSDLPALSEEDAVSSDTTPDTGQQTDAVEQITLDLSEAVDDELVIPDWLGETSLDKIESPDWLLDDSGGEPPVSTPEVSPDSSEWMADLRHLSDEDEDAPDVPGEGDSSSKKAQGEAPAETPVVETDGPGDSPDQTDQPELDEQEKPDDESTLAAAAAVGTVAAGTIAASAASGASAGIAATSRMANWLDSFDATDQPGGEDRKTTETTGMLAGISTLLPSEKVAIPSPETEADADSIAAAAHQFYQIATTPPQPATLPKPLTVQEKIAGRAVRSGLYLLFILLIALPLLPGFQKEMNGKFVPWTEPDREFSDVLDSQRRQLISEQLGIIDLQQPDSVALVSFDYSASTQGEMEPLAGAVLGRLKGQGMRVVAISLEPEGASLAQNTLETILTDREENYGQTMVNLGYLPGQAVAIRQLATGEKQLSEIPDFKDGVTFNDASRSSWEGIENLRQINMVVTLADNAAIARSWVEQLEIAQPPDSGERYLMAATSAVAEPFLTPYRDSEQLNGLISGINGTAAIEAGRRNFGPARQMIDSLSIAHLLIVILMAVGTMVGWMPSDSSPEPSTKHVEKKIALPTDKDNGSA